jgi:hypothetical protein
MNRTLTSSNHHQQSANNGISNRLSLKCIYCQLPLGSVSIKCEQCDDFFLCLKVK